MPIAGLKSIFGVVLLPNTKLMISEYEIYLREGCSAMQLIREIIDSRQGISIFDGELIQLSIVYA